MGGHGVDSLEGNGVDSQRFIFGPEALPDTRRAMRRWMAAVCERSVHDAHDTPGVVADGRHNGPGVMHALLLLQLFYEVGAFCFL